MNLATIQHQAVPASSMKAITLWQPWASLVAAGEKHFETRAWYTAHRGLLAIHAGAALCLEHRALCAEEPFRSALRRAGITDPRALPLGRVVVICKLVNCYKIRPGFNAASADAVAQERAFGDWTPGRYAWHLANPLQLVTPIPAQGHQGLWEWEPPAEFKAAVSDFAERLTVLFSDAVAGAERGSVP